MDDALLLRLNLIVANALAEDIGEGDFTALWTIPAGARAGGDLFAKADGVVAGLEVAALAFRLLDDRVRFTAETSDGSPVHRGDVIARVEGPARSLLSAERTALNFLQRMSGIATATRRYVDACAGTNAVILDTRKTAPGLRLLDKWAVRLGGGQNHRTGLYDMVLIKDNHIAAVGGIPAAVDNVRQGMKASGRRLLIEVEVTSLAELRQALDLAVDRVMLDNMTPEVMREAVRIADGRVRLEASGGVTIENVSEIARTGVDYISVGALTHSVRALDISLELQAS